MSFIEPGVSKAPVITRKPNRDHPGTVDVKVRCPFCQKLHRHGLSELPSEQGVRASRCNGELYEVVDEGSSGT